MPSSRTAGVGLLALATFGSAALGAGIGRAVLTAYLPLVLERIQDAPVLIGLVMASNPIAGILVPLVIGGPIDRSRRHGHDPARAVLLGGALLGSGGMAAVGLLTGTGYLLLAAAAFVAYTGFAAGMTLHRSLVSERFPPPYWARATGAQEVALLVGSVVGIVVGATIALFTPLPFLLAAVLALGATMLTLGSPIVSGRRDAGAPPAGPAPRPERPRIGEYLALVRRPGARVLIGVEALWVFGYAAIPAFFLLYAQEVLGIGPAAASAALLFFGGIVAASTILTGGSKDLGHRRTIAIVASLGLAGGLTWMSFAGSVLVVAPGLVVAAAGFGAISALGFPLFAAFARPEEGARQTAVYFSIRSAAAALALPTAGLSVVIADDYRAVFGMGVVPMLVSAGLLLLLRTEGAPGS